MKKTLLLICLLAATAMAQQAKVTPLISKNLTDLPGKEGLMITVDYPPGASDPVHRHNAHVFVYVLEGSVVMQVKGSKETRTHLINASVESETRQVGASRESFRRDVHI